MSTVSGLEIFTDNILLIREMFKGKYANHLCFKIFEFSSSVGCWVLKADGLPISLGGSASLGDCQAISGDQRHSLSSHTSQSPAIIQ